MNCIVCGKTAQIIREKRPAKYRVDVVEVDDEFFRCDSCGEEFVTPAQIKEHARIVKNEVRKKYGLLPPERIVEIREKAGLTQVNLERLLGTGPKVVPRWESGKVIQSCAHDLVLRMLEQDPKKTIQLLEELSKARADERKKYSQAHSHGGAAVVA
jgi:putative zinc finger/helix-turn-helix YgiT family protein